MEKRKFIIDTDPGVDDAFAIITAFVYPGIEVKGLTTVAGNKGLDVVSKNAMKLVKLVGADCTVYKGAAVSLRHIGDLDNYSNEGAGDIHGADGLGGVDLPFDDHNLSDINAVDFILDTIRENPGEIEILAIGPVTNIALAIQKDPDTFKKVKCVWTMGGGVKRGNVTPVAEFNYWFDPEAAEVLFQMGSEIEIVMFGLDTTYDTYFTMNDLFFLKEEGGKTGRAMFEMTQPYAHYYWNTRRITGAVIHDLLPLIYAIDPSISDESDKYHCSVSVSCESTLTQGQTVVDLKNQFSDRKNAYVVMAVDARKFKETFIEIVFKDVADLYRRYVHN